MRLSSRFCHPNGHFKLLIAVSSVLNFYNWEYNREIEKSHRTLSQKKQDRFFGTCFSKETVCFTNRYSSFKRLATRFASVSATIRAGA